MNKIINKFFRFFEKITGNAIEKYRFKKNLGYKLNLKDPKSFNQKIVWKKINDRNPLLPITADKYRVIEYVRKVLGEEKAKEILIPLLYVTDKPENIPFDKLPEEYIIKANHNSGPPIIVGKDKPLNKIEIIKECKRQLNTPYGILKYEWAYEPIKRKIVIEELLKDEKGNIPKDYKFFMIANKCRLVQVDCDRFTNHSRTIYDSDWNLLDVSYTYKKGIVIKKPYNLNSMLFLAEKISRDFDFVRVDFYEIKNKIYFGELTHYPESGRGKFSPRSFDFKLGEYWKVKLNYWKNE